jgi:hypothetical protein
MGQSTFILEIHPQKYIHDYISWATLRPDPTHLMFSYSDNDHGTINARILITDLENDAVFYDENFIGYSFISITLAGAENTHVYRSDLTVVHSDFGTFTETQTLGVWENNYQFPKPPGGLLGNGPTG